MILLYTTLLCILVLARFLIGRRVKSLEQKYIRVARETDALAKANTLKDGNSNKVDPCLSAKRVFQLGLLTQKRERVEAKYAAWQRYADAFGRYVANVRGWKGKKLPYTFGVVDLACALSLIDYLGFGKYVGVGVLFHYIMDRWTG